MSFDPLQYKRTTREQWEDAAEAWHRWGPTLESWLGPATEVMLDAAGVSSGSHVLDVAAGAGGQAVAAARRVGRSGRVLATDISPTILTYAAKAAAEAGLTNVVTVEADGEALDGLAPGSFDAVISRLGLIYFPDQRAALAGMRRGARLDHSPAGEASRSRTRTAGPVQPRRPRSPGVASGNGRLHRRPRRGRPRPAAHAVGGGVRPVRARVLRRPAPDVDQRRGRAATGGLGGDRDPAR